MKAPFLFYLIFFLYSAQAQTGFIIHGELENAEGLKVYLTQRGGALTSGTETLLLDSAIVKSRHFEMKGRVEEPNYYSILVENKRGWKPFLLENKTYQLTGDADKIWQAKIEGSEEIEIYKEYATQVNPLIEKLNAASDSSFMMETQGDTALARMYGEQNQFYNHQIKMVARDIILKYPDSYTGLFLFGELDQILDKAERKEVYEVFSDRIKQHSFAKTLYYELYELDDLIGVGKQAISFSLQDQFGNTVHLSDYKGKYVLVDFWASWCGPCRGDHPFLIDLYHQYQSKGFEILSVSIDKKPERWKRAIEEDGLPWQNVLDLKDGKNEVASQYGIKMIPTNFLLDKNGVLIARDIRGEALAEKLSELFR